MKNLNKLTGLGVACSLLLSATPVFAVQPTDVATRKAALIERKTATPPAGIVRSCQTREEAVEKRLTQLIDLSVNMQRVFDRHSQRVQNYYTTVVVPSGKTVANYDSLVANIQTKKAAVQTAIDEAQANVDAFSCTSGDPKSVLSDFRVDMQAVKKALKDYRTAVRNLVVAVHSVAPKASPTPTPTASPAPTPTI